MKKSIFIKAFTAVLLTAALASCSFMQEVESHNSVSSNADDKALGYITVGNTTCARTTIVPESDTILLSKLTSVSLSYERTEDSSTGTISGTADPDNNITAWNNFISQFPYALQTGSYSFTLTAQLNGITFQATRTASITKDTTEALKFTLTPPADTNGSLKVTWNITDGSPASAELTLTGTVDSDSKTYNDLTSGTVVYENNSLFPGDYDLTVNFLAAESNTTLPVLNTWTGKVRIARGLETSASIDWAIDTTYDITWELNGGTAEEGGYVFAEKYTRKSEITLPTLTKAGYDFEGWYGNSGFSGDTINSIPKGSYGAKEFYAKWTPRTDTVYRVRHNRQKADQSPDQHYSVHYVYGEPEIFTGTTDTLVTFELKDTSTTDPDDPFYGFDPPSEEELETARALTILGNGNRYVDLFYTRRLVTIKYDAQCSDSAFPHITKQDWYGGSHQIYSRTPVREGYIFKGWALKSNAGEGDTIYKIGTANRTYTIDQLNMVTFYAQWQVITNTVTFDTNGGTEIDAQIVPYGQKVEPPQTNPTKEDYSFKGWYADSNFTTEFDFSSTPITANTTIYAKWILDNHYAKIDGTYYNSYADAKDALTALSGGEHTIVFYSVDVADLGKASDSTGDLFNVIANSHATAVHLVIHEDANLRFGSDNEAAFSTFNNLVSADLRGLKSAGTLGAMFDSCMNLESVIFAEDFDTSNIIYADGMFYNCSKLTTLDLSMFDTSKIARMTKMFAGCSSLTTIYVSDKFVTNSVLGDYAGQVFSSCTSLVGGKGTSFSELGVIDATAAKVDGGTSNPGYFTLKSSSGSVTLSFDSNGGSYIDSQILQSGEYALRPKTPAKEGFIFDGWYTDSEYTNEFDFTTTTVNSDTTLYAKWIKRNGQFAKINDTYCNSFDDVMAVLTEVLPNNGVKDITITLYDSSLTASMLGTPTTQNSLLGIINAKNGDNYIYDSVSLIFASGSGIVLGGTEFNGRFEGAQTLVYVDLSGITAIELTAMDGMFYNCTNLETVIFGGNFDTSHLVSMGHLFTQNTNLTRVDFGNIDVRTVENMTSMFAGCSSISEIDLTSFEPSSVKDFSGMFEDCINLTTIYATTKFVFPDSGVTDDSMFQNCVNLAGDKGTTYPQTNLRPVEYARLDGGPETAPGYFSRKPVAGLSCNVGDVILNDGTVIPYVAGTKLNEQQSAAAIAVIFYDGTGSLGNRPLGIGLYQPTSLKPLMLENAAGYDTTLASDNNSGKVFTQAVYSCSDYNGNLYPAFGWLEQYFKDTSGALDSSVYKDGWYLPAKNELLEIYSKMEAINQTLNMINNKNAMGFVMDIPYFAAYQSPAKVNFAGYMSFQTGEWAEDCPKKEEFQIRAIHEF